MKEMERAVTLLSLHPHGIVVYPIMLHLRVSIDYITKLVCVGIIKFKILINKVLKRVVFIG